MPTVGAALLFFWGIWAFLTFFFSDNKQGVGVGFIFFYFFFSAETKKPLSLKRNSKHGIPEKNFLIIFLAPEKKKKKAKSTHTKKANNTIFFFSSTPSSPALFQPSVLNEHRGPAAELQLEGERGHGGRGGLCTHACPLNRGG